MSSKLGLPLSRPSYCLSTCPAVRNSLSLEEIKQSLGSTLTTVDPFHSEGIGFQVNKQISVFEPGSSLSYVPSGIQLAHLLRFL